MDERNSGQSCQSCQIKVGYTGESELASAAYTSESRLPYVGYTEESSLTGVAYTDELSFWLNNTGKICGNLKSP
jgi:hypothetical protein